MKTHCQLKLVMISKQNKIIKTANKHFQNVKQFDCFERQ